MAGIETGSGERDFQHSVEREADFLQSAKSVGAERTGHVGHVDQGNRISEVGPS
jgi:hypothetical protein